MALLFEAHRENQKYRDYIQPMNQDVYQILASRASGLDLNLAQASILDYGCNQGHLLTTAQGRITPRNYWGIDTNLRALELAKAKHPDANWVHYDCYNNTFNPDGKKVEDLPLDRQFDLVVAHGVFTHSFMADTVRELDLLRRYVRTGGLLLFSVWEDVDFYGYLGFLDRELGINTGLSKPLNFQNSLILVDRKVVLIDVERAPEEAFDWIETFHRPEYIQRQISGAVRTYGSPVKHPIYAIKA